jgi:hypothetical protein
LILILDIQTLILSGSIFWSEHLALRLRERGIKRADIISCINNGEIIEQYPGDKPFPSCLILGTSTSGKPLHVVCGLDYNTCCYMITSYYPSTDKWKLDFKTRKVD